MSDILNKVIESREESEKRDISFAEIVSSLLSLVRSRQAEILRLRHGLFNERKHTLEEIGKKMNLTRERIRQLEKIATQNIRQHKNFDGIVAPAKHIVTSALAEHGGLASKELLVKSLLIDEEMSELGTALEFLIDNFIDEIKELNLNSFKNGWYIHDDHLELAKQTVAELKDLIELKKKLLHQEELVEHFKKSDFYGTNQERFKNFLEKNNNDLPKVINSYLNLSADLGQTPFNQWGLNESRLINPRRINDKIYLVLNWYGKPLHFREIADKINEAKFDKKVAHPATIHNDLISDSRFVLIGRGVYALKDWGYKTGIVADVVADILKEAGGSLTRDEIIKKVLEQRNVKPNTIGLILNKDDRFERVGGKYKLKMNNE